MSSDQIELNEIAVELVLPLRFKLLRSHQSLAECNYPGDEDANSFHWGAFSDSQLVAIASVCQQQEGRFQLFSQAAQYRLRGMATLEEFRGQGYGQAVLKACLEKCWAQGGELLWCNARTSAAGFYEKMGFSTLPDEFELPGIGPHRVMYQVG